MISWIRFHKDYYEWDYQVEVFVSPHLAGGSSSGLNFVHQKRRVILRANLLQTLKNDKIQVKTFTQFKSFFPQIFCRPWKIQVKLGQKSLVDHLEISKHKFNMSKILANCKFVHIIAVFLNKSFANHENSKIQLYYLLRII